MKTDRALGIALPRKIEALSAPLHRPGPGRTAFLVAEIGGNHGGDPELAASLVRAAARAGADAVKFQAYRTDNFLSPLSPYRDELAAEELPFPVLAELAALARGLGLGFGLTVFGGQGLALAGEVEADFLKISSGDLTYHQLLAAAARAGRPLFVSTGAADEAEVERALEVLRPAGDRLVLLQCASLYPAPPEAANLAVMSGWLARGLKAGYSDHSLGNRAAEAALTLGALVLEKHFTLDRALPGGDNFMSATVEDMAALAAWNRQAAELRGSGTKAPAPGETEIRPLIRRAVVAERDLPAGRALAEGDLALKRPASAGPLLGPEALRELAGRTVRRALKRGQALTGADLEPPDRG